MWGSCWKRRAGLSSNPQPCPCRFEFFKSEPARLRAKLEDFILAALNEDRVQHERELTFLACERGGHAATAGELQR